MQKLLSFGFFRPRGCVYVIFKHFNQLKMAQLRLNLQFYPIFMVLVICAICNCGEKEALAIFNSGGCGQRKRKSQGMKQTAETSRVWDAIWRRAGAQSAWLRTSQCWRQGEGLMRWVSWIRNGEADSEVRDKVRKDPHTDDSKLQRTHCTLFLPTKAKSHPFLKPFLLCNHSCAEEITCLSERGPFFSPGWQVLLCSSSVFWTLQQILFFFFFFALEHGKAITKTEPDLMTSLDIL